MHETDVPCRCLMASTRDFPEVAEYPDSRGVNVYDDRDEGVAGLKFRLADMVDYWDGEARRASP